MQRRWWPRICIIRDDTVIIFSYMSSVSLGFTLEWKRGRMTVMKKSFEKGALLSISFMGEWRCGTICYSICRNTFKGAIGKNILRNFWMWSKTCYRTKCHYINYRHIIFKSLMKIYNYRYKYLSFSWYFLDIGMCFQI